MRFHGGKALQRGRILLAFNVIHHTRYHLVTKPVASAGHNVSVLVLLVQDKVASSPSKLGEGLGHVVRDPTPEAARLESAQLQRGDDTEIVDAASEGNPKVWIGFRACPHYLARCEHDFELQHRIAGKASPAREHGQATWY